MCYQEEGLVGAVGIENTTRRNFKDLEGMQGNAKALKRNNWECKGILNGPSFFSTSEIPASCISLTVQIASRLRAQILQRGWQADLNPY